MESVHEEWRAVKGCEGQYEVSDQGRVRSLDRIVMRRSGPMHSCGRVLATWKCNSGYLQVRLGQKGPSCMVHRLVMATFCGSPPEGEQVNHVDGNKKNNVLSNLEYVTPSQNIAHAMASGLMPCIGEENRSARHTEKQIRAAYELVASGSTYLDACAATGVSHSALISVLHGRKWQSLGLPVIRRMAVRA